MLAFLVRRVLISVIVLFFVTLIGFSITHLLPGDPVTSILGETGSPQARVRVREELNGLYVAMTRAKDHLHMIVPQRFFAHQQRMNGDRHMYAQRTRFIPDAMLDHFERCAWPPAVHESSSRASSPPKPVDLGARLKQMWR